MENITNNECELKDYSKVKNVITFGTFDLFHEGHYNLLKRAKMYGERLIVGVSSDELNFKKGKKSMNDLNQRLEIVSKNFHVDEVFIEESLEDKNFYIKKYNADILIMGDDWKNKFDWVSCKVIYLERTINISSTILKTKISCDEINDKLKLLFNDENNFFLPSIGITNIKINMHTNLIQTYAQVIFNILNKYYIDYYVFAGSSIGLLRNGQSIPWVDDYDIIIFEDKICEFEKIISIIELNGFSILKHGPGSYQIFGNKINNKYFQLDIFVSIYDENNIIKNLNCAGLYHFNNIHKNIIYPPKYYNYENILLPFFNDVKKDVFIEYGNIYENCVIYIDHGNDKIELNQHFTLVYNAFNKIKLKCIENTLEKIKEKTCKINILDLNIDYEYLTNNYVLLSLDLLTYINNNNIDNITLSSKLIYFTCDIKFYFPNIKINLIINEFIPNYIIYMNYADNILFKEQEILNSYNNELIYYNKKPNFQIY